MRLVGYLTQYPEGIAGERGVCFNYILAANGIFVEAESPVIAARIPAADCEIRGLAPLEPKVTLTYGSIPQRFWDLALDVFLSNPEIEQYCAVIGAAGYHFYVPQQEKTEVSVTYQMGTGVVLDLHSHGHMLAGFSPKDNEDDQGLKLYGVVGSLHEVPVVKFRVGVYGYFMELRWKDIFSGTIAGALEEYGYEEVKTGDLCSEPGAACPKLENPGHRVWWNWWLRR